MTPEAALGRKYGFNQVSWWTDRFQYMVGKGGEIQWSLIYCLYWLKCLLSFILLSLILARVRVALFSFQAQVFASLNLHSLSSVTQHQYLMVHRGSFWWIQSHFLASLAPRKVLQGPWWVGRWLQPSRDIYGILPSSTQLFGPTFIFECFKLNLSYYYLFPINLSIGTQEINSMSYN